MFIQRIILLFLVGTFFCASMQAQYRVIIAQGRNYININNSFHQLEPGELLADSARINLVDNAKLTLMDKEGRFLVLDKTGNYNLSKASSDSTLTSSKLIYGIWTDYFENIDRNEEELDFELGASDAFEIFLPSSSEVYGFELFLKWTSLPNANYRIDLLDEFETIFLQINTNESYHKLDLLSKELAWKRQVFVRVTELKSKRETSLIGISKLTPPDLDDANSVLKLLPDDASEISILTRAAYFEQKGWIADVHALLFENATKNEIIRLYYLSFIERNEFFNLINEVRK